MKIIKRNLVVLMIVVLLSPISIVEGTNTWNETENDFRSGSVSNLIIKDANLSLAKDDSTAREWILHTRDAPYELNSASMVYDPVRKETLLVGGWNLSGPSYDIWAFNWSTNSWMKRPASNSPLPRTGAFMVYDDFLGEILLFGGSNGSARQNDTWTFNTSSLKWTNLNTGPSYSFIPRQMVYDSKNKAAILCGDSSSYFLMYVFDSSVKTWKVSYAIPSDSRRGGYAMAYDRVNGLVLLFGGQSSSYLNDTWTYDLTTDSWSQLNLAVSPGPRAYMLSAFDESLGEMLVYGGDPAAQGELWSLNISQKSWINRTASGPPKTSYFRAMACDGSRGKELLFVVPYGNGPGFETWCFDGTKGNWTLLDESDVPRARQRHAMAYDSRNGLAVLFGGNVWYAGDVNDTWVYSPSNNTWSRRYPSLAPDNRSTHSMAYDSRAGLVLLFGGEQFQNDTWTYNASSNSWTEMKPADAPQYPFMENAYNLIYDSTNDIFILYAASYDETWTYNLSANTWKNMKPSVKPPQRQGACMAYDSTAGKAFLFGGRDSSTGSYLNDAWFYDYPTNKWTQRYPLVNPPGRYRAVLTDYPAGGGVLLFGGSTNAQYSPQNDTWVYNYSRNTWANKPGASQPPARFDSAGFYSYSNDRTYIYSGESRLNVFFTDTWSIGPSQFMGSGNYTSAAFDTGGTAYFGNITAACNVSSNTSVQFQVRTAGTQAQLNASGFIGPDGTPGTYYLPGDRLSGVHNVSRWVQYRAYLSTKSTNETPGLSEVTIHYNLMQNITVTYPNGRDTVTDYSQVTWTAADPDGDTLKFDVYLVNGTGSRLLASDLPDGTRAWPWNLTDVPSGIYKVRIDAKDENPDIPLLASDESPEFSVFNPNLSNRAPYVELLEPLDNATFGETTVNLSWFGYDEDNDSLTYMLFVSESPFELSSLPAPYLVTGETCATLSDLTDGATYWWAVLPRDWKVNGTTQDLWRFNIRIPVPNRPPSAELAAPPDGQVFNVTDVTLAWTGSDPDGDRLNYYILFSNNTFDNVTVPEALANVTTTAYQLAGLANGTTYHWTIIVCDGKVNGTMPAVRTFRIDRSVGNHPPRMSSTPPPKAVVGKELVYNITAYDEDGDNFTFSLPSPAGGMSIGSISGRFAWTPSATQKGNQTVTVRVTDDRGGYDEQRFTLFVEEPVVQPNRPTVKITSPSNGSKVRGTIMISGTAARGDGDTLRVFIRYDDRGWLLANGNATWKYELNTGSLGDGRHVVEARANDGLYDSEVVSVTLVVDNPVGTTPTNDMLLFVAIIIIVFVGIVIGLYLLKRKGKPTGT